MGRFALWLLLYLTGPAILTAAVLIYPGRFLEMMREIRRDTRR